MNYKDELNRVFTLVSEIEGLMSSGPMRAWRRGLELHDELLTKAGNLQHMAQVAVGRAEQAEADLKRFVEELETARARATRDAEAADHAHADKVRGQAETMTKNDERIATQTRELTENDKTIASQRARIAQIATQLAEQSAQLVSARQH